MDRLEQLNKEKSNMIDRHRRERQSIEDKITKEKECIKRNKESKKKEKQLQQNNLTLTDTAYKDFVKDSLSIAELNEKFKKIINQK